MSYLTSVVLSHISLLVLALAVLTGCAETQLAAHMVKSIGNTAASDGNGDFKVGSPYAIAGKTYTPRERYNYTQTGVASWYGHKFHGKKTANGERFSRFELTAAHKTLQLPSLVQVTNLENGRSLVVRVNDRGPFKRGRIIDLSERAAELLGFKKQGTARVRLGVLPQKSRRIAEAAKRGESTAGTAIAANKALQRGQRVAQATSAQQPRPTVQRQRKGVKKTEGEPTKLASASKQTRARMQQEGKAYERPRRHVRKQRLKTGQNQSPQNGGNTVRGERQNPVVERQGRNNVGAETPPSPMTQLSSNTTRAGRQSDVVQETADVQTTKIGELVTKKDIAPTGLYVQAGSFTKRRNAKQLARKLRRVETTNILNARVDGQRFYRVRLGPLKNVESADEVLNRVIALGHNNAMIVVDEKQHS